jgi:hypothetical protein
MEINSNTPPPLNLSEERVQPIVLIAQLMKNMETMHHVDEAFLWLANAMTHCLDIPVIQFWASQQDISGQPYTDVRAIASQDPSLPQPVHLNTQVMVIIKHLFHEKRSITSLPIEGVFSALQASLFAHYNLHYWASFLLQNEALLPPTMTGTTLGKTSTPLVMIVTLFTQSPLSTDQARSTRFILEQALRVTINRGFLIFPASASRP